MEEPMANSSRLVLPIKTAPLCLSFVTTLASYLGIKSARICDPHVVLIPFVHKRSFKAMGIPVKADILFLAISKSAFFAWSRTLPSSIVIKAAILSSNSPMRSSNALVNSTDVIFPSESSSFASKIFSSCNCI